MSPETLLLAEIIHKTPSVALWIISSDSWENLKTIFKQYLKEENTQWVIEIEDTNKDLLVENIKSYDLGETIIHTWLMSKGGYELFSSYDRMVMVTIDRTLGISAEFLNEIGIDAYIS